MTVLVVAVGDRVYFLHLFPTVSGFGGWEKNKKIFHATIYPMWWQFCGGCLYQFEGHISVYSGDPYMTAYVVGSSLIKGNHQHPIFALNNYLLLLTPSCLCTECVKCPNSGLGSFDSSSSKWNMPWFLLSIKSVNIYS